jgi:MFS family permease
VPDEPRRSFLKYLRGTVRDYSAIPSLVLLWFGYAAWNAALSGTSNLSLYTREALGRDPKDFSGIIYAIRFGTKAAAGWFLGMLALKKGLRASVLATLGIFAIGIAWPLIAPGYSYLACFGFMGAGELGGTYFPNYAALLSSPSDAPRFVSLLTLAAPVASFAPVLYGAVSDHFGFRASFVLGSLVAIVGLFLVARIRKN